jgi:diguanylate cyclase (GGDEF)-like protein
MPATTTRDEVTLLEKFDVEQPSAEQQEICLVQIYPADVIDGMILLEADSLIVGRDELCDLHLADSSVSRRHAELRRIGSEYTIVDLGSTNGTLVNGVRVEQQRLSAGDCVKIGSYIFKFLAAGSVESQYLETVYSVMTGDALTGAFNKRYLLENLQREIARATRHGRPLSLVMMDIDKFKSINDTHGHLVGDEVLREFGQRIARECRGGDDLFARYGGEEFALVLAETTPKEARAKAEHFRHTVASTPFVTAAGKLTITSSFGIACFAGSAVVETTELIHQADVQLYAAKQAGRNCVKGPH